MGSRFSKKSNKNPFHRLHEIVNSSPSRHPDKRREYLMKASCIFYPFSTVRFQFLNWSAWDFSPLCVFNSSMSSIGLPEIFLHCVFSNDSRHSDKTGIFDDSIFHKELLLLKLFVGQNYLRARNI